jgi:anti-sigma-K factor RskA
VSEMGPMGPMDRTRFEELRDAYALGALTEEERREFEEHLAAYPERQAEVEELGAVAGLLALYPEEQEPPAELRARIMGVVEAEARPQRAEQRPSGPGVFGRLGELLRARRLAFGAAALLVVGLFSWNMVLRSEVQGLQGRVQSLQSQPQGPRMIEFEGTGAKQGARAELVVLEGDGAVLMAEDMPPLPEGQTYQIWVIEDDTPEPSGLFEPADGPVAAVVESPLEGADAVAVTVEPEGGSPQPTSDPMLVAEVRA